MRERKTIFGLALHLRELISRGDKVCDQVVGAKSCKCKVTDFVSGIEGTTYQIARGPDVSRPGHNGTSEIHIGTRLKALQSVFFDEVIAKSTESKSGVVVAETRSGD